MQDINNLSDNLLHIIGYVKINEIALEINFFEKIINSIFKRKRHVFYFDYYFLYKFRLSAHILHNILDFLGFIKIAGTTNVSYWKKKKFGHNTTYYDKNSPFYVLKKLQ